MKRFINDIEGNAVLTLVFTVIVIAALTLAVAFGLNAQRTIRNQDQKIKDLALQVDALKNQPDNTQKTHNDGQKIVSRKGIQALLYVPTIGMKLSTPIAVMGEIPGNWSSEASFPVEVKDANGQVIGKTNAQILGDWMTDKLVPFSVKIMINNPPNGDAVLIMRKDNPSGIPANDDSFEVPIKL